MRKKSQEKNHAVMPLVGVEFGEREKNGGNKSSYLSFLNFEMFWIKWAAFTSFLSFTTLFYAVKSLFLMTFDGTKV